jgi:CRP-like cAMP-binding protein
MAHAANAIYLAPVNSPSLTPDEIRAAAETHRDLGPDYQSAVIESFLDKVGREIDARVDARVAAAQPPAPPAKPAARERSAFALAVVSMAFGIPLTALTVTAGTHPVGIGGLLVVWLAIAVINVAYSMHLRPPPPSRR